MVTDQEIAQAVQSLIQESNPNTFTTINGVVQELQSKLGQDLSHKVDFIRNQINLFYATTYSQPTQPQQSQPLSSNDRFALQQNPNFHPRPPAPPPAASPAVQIFTCPDATSNSAGAGASVAGATVVTGTEPPKNRLGFLFH